MTRVADAVLNSDALQRAATANGLLMAESSRLRDEKRELTENLNALQLALDTITKLENENIQLRLIIKANGMLSNGD